MNSLVFLKSGHPFTDSQIIAKAVGRKHNQVLKVIEGVFDDYPNFRGRVATPKVSGFEPVFIAEERQYSGECFTAYLLNESAFNLILPRFKTRKALDAFLHLITSFQQIKIAIIQAEANKDNLLWQALRIDGKQTRHNLTDAVKSFGSYSKEQGSNGYKFLYSNITNAIHKSLGISSISTLAARDALPTAKLKQLEYIEQRVSKELYKGMESGLDYKVIKEIVKKCIQTEKKEVA